MLVYGGVGGDHVWGGAGALGVDGLVVCAGVYYEEGGGASGCGVGWAAAEEWEVCVRRKEGGMGYPVGVWRWDYGILRVGSYLFGYIGCTDTVQKVVGYDETRCG